jgi:hypothetical protein
MSSLEKEIDKLLDLHFAPFSNTTTGGSYGRHDFLRSDASRLELGGIVESAETKEGKDY